MSSALNQPGDCCTPCTTPSVQQVPGPQGPAGANGTNGTDGINAFTTTSAPFNMPNSGNSVTVAVGDAAWMVGGQIVFVETAGFMQVTGVVGNNVTFKNLGYTGNAAGGTIIPSASHVSPGGIIGPTGASGSATLNQLSPTTTKGDLIVDNGANSPNASDVRMAVGSNKQVLHADNTSGTGLSYKTIDLSGTGTSLANQLAIGNGGTGQATQQAALDALAPSAPTVGDLLYYNGTHWVSLSKGTALQALRVNSGATGLEYADPPQAVVQMVVASTQAYSTFATTMANTDTVPVKTDGTQILQVSITPKNVANRLKVRCSIMLNTGDVWVAALFLGTSNTAFYATTGSGATYQQVSFEAVVSAGTTSAVNVTLRMASNDGATMEINGFGGSRKLGGVATSSLIVEEWP